MRWNYKDIVRWAVSRALVGTGEQGVLSCQCHGPHGPFDGVGIQFQAAIFQEQDQTIPVVQRVTDGLANGGTTGDAGELLGQPGMHRLDQGSAVLLACQPAFLGGLATQIGLDRVKRRDPPQEPRPRAAPSWRHGCRRISVRAWAQHSACWTPVSADPDEADKAGVAIGLQQTAEALQMVGRMLALAIFAVDISGGGMTGSVPGPVVDRVAPEPSGLRPASAGIQHRQGGVVGEHFGRGQHRAQHQFMQRRQPPAGAADPVAQGGTIQRHALTGEDLGLAIQRQMIAIFADQRHARATPRWPCRHRLGAPARAPERQRSSQPRQP